MILYDKSILSKINFTESVHKSNLCIYDQFNSYLSEIEYTANTHKIIKLTKFILYIQLVYPQKTASHFSM